MSDDHSNEPWPAADSFFLSDRLRCGASVEEVAGFLGRSITEVLAQAKQLHVLPGIERTRRQVGRLKP
jgi:hypothetical protein